MAKYNELMNGLLIINKCLSVDMDVSNGNMLMEALSERIGLLSYTDTLSSLNEGFYHWAKGVVFDMMREDPSLAGIKETQLRLYIAGKMAHFEAMNEKTKKTIRNLEISIESLRTMISYLGKQINSSI